MQSCDACEYRVCRRFARSSSLRGVITWRYSKPRRREFLAWNEVGRWIRYALGEIAQKLRYAINKVSVSQNAAGIPKRQEHLCGHHEIQKYHDGPTPICSRSRPLCSIRQSTPRHTYETPQRKTPSTNPSNGILPSEAIMDIISRRRVQIVVSDR